MTELVAIVPTHGRPSQLTKALRSIAGQRRLPDSLLIIGESEEDLEGSKDDLRKTPLFPRTEWLINTRTSGLSGSIDTGLLHILDKGGDPKETFIALLDDDDYWDPTYLEVCMNEAGISWP